MPKTDIRGLTPCHPTLPQARLTHLVQVHKVAQVVLLERLEVTDGRADAVDTRGWCVHACMHVCVLVCTCVREDGMRIMVMLWCWY